MYDFCAVDLVLTQAFMRIVMTALAGACFWAGIHTDGLLTPLMHLSSYGDKEKKLEILKDPHTGAFAIIGAVMYYLLFFGL